MDADVSSNTVRLTRENIDLKRRLEESEELVDALKLKLSQQAKHVFTHEVRSSNLSLADVLGGKSAASSTMGVGGGGVSGAVSAGEYDALEAELDETRQREDALRAQVQRLEEELQKQRQLQQLTPQRPRSHTFSHAGGGSEGPQDTATSELHSARKKIEALENSEKKLRAAVDDLNAALEATMLTTPSPPVDATHDRSGGIDGEHSPLIEELEDKLLAEQAAQALLAEELEETKFYMEEEKREFDRKINEAMSEKNIAVRVKNEALKEAATARTEAARLRGELSSTKGSGRQPQDLPPTPDALILRDQVTFLESRLAAVQKDLELSQKDAARAHKAGKRAFLERQTALKDLEAWKLKQVESVKMKVTANAKSAMSMSVSSSSHSHHSHNEQHRQTQQDHLHVETCVESAAQKLGVIQERLLMALTQRSVEGTEVHHHHHRDPQGGTTTTTTSTSQGSATDLTNTTRSSSSGDGEFSSGSPASSHWIAEQLFMGGDDWAHLVCEEFYSYERIIQNLKSEVLSLQTIARMSDDDAAGHWKRKIEAMQEEMDVLRVTAHEYREAAATADSRHQQQMKGFFEAQQLQALEYQRHQRSSPGGGGETTLVGRVVASSSSSPQASSAQPSPGGGGGTSPYYHQPSYSSSPGGAARHL
jgi:hypothetical protein